MTKIVPSSLPYSVQKKPPIFISAASNGLSWYRDELVEILSANQLSPIEMKGFETPLGEISEVVNSKIDAAAGVICLVGKAYGSPSGVPIPGFTDRFYSYTHLEWLRAFSKIETKAMITLFARDAALINYQDTEPEHHQVLQAEWRATIKECLREPGTRAGNASFSSPYEFAKILAKLRWKNWLDGSITEIS